MNRLENFRILVLHDDPNRRARLRETLGLIAVKGTVRSSQSLSQAIRTFHQITDVDCIFLPSSLKMEEVDTLLAAVIQVQPEKRPFFILTLSAAQQSHDVVASFAIRGIDAFLQEPFSSSEIGNTLLTLNQRRDNPVDESRKLLGTAQFVFQSAVTLIDSVSLDLVQGKPGGYAMRDLRRLGPIIKDLHSRLGDEVLEGMIDHFLSAECTDAVKYKKTEKRKKAVHPGVTLKGIMEKRGLTPARIAAALSTEENTITRIIECSESVTEDIAKGLSHLLGETPRYWLSLQQDYDKYKQSSEGMMT